MKLFFLITFIICCQVIFAQQTQASPQPQISASIFDGILAGGYVDGGGYLNFTGPNINLKYKNIKVILGMLPSLRFKEDESKPTKNSLVTPNLGGGLTCCYKHVAIQLPLYYNAKTNSKNGVWVIGLGIGYVLKK